MAKQKDTEITGTVGDIIFYKWKGMFCMRAKGNTGKQAPVAVKNGGYFGKASGVSARLRKLLAPILAEPKSRRLMYRLNNALYALLRTDVLDTLAPVNNLPHLSGFSMFEQDDIAHSLTGYLTVERLPDGVLQLKIPAYNTAYMSMGNGYPYLHLKVVIAACDVQGSIINRTYEQSIILPYVDAHVNGKEIMLPFQCIPGQLTITTAAMGYMNEKQEPVPEAGWRYAGIIGAMWN